MLVTGSLAPGRKEVWCGLEVERELWDGVGSTNSRRASSEFSAVDRQRGRVDTKPTNYMCYWETGTTGRRLLETARKTGTGEEWRKSIGAADPASNMTIFAARSPPVISCISICRRNTSNRG